MEWEVRVWWRWPEVLPRIPTWGTRRFCGENICKILGSRANKMPVRRPICRSKSSATSRMIRIPLVSLWLELGSREEKSRQGGTYGSRIKKMRSNLTVLNRKWAVTKITKEIWPWWEGTAVLAANWRTSRARYFLVLQILTDNRLKCQEASCK